MEDRTQWDALSSEDSENAVVVVDCTTGEVQVRGKTKDELAVAVLTLEESQRESAARAEIDAKRERLATLNALGVDALTANEKDEAFALVLDLACS